MSTTAHDKRHNWQRTTHRVTVYERQQDAKTCSRCGMERTRDPDTKTLYLFRPMNAERWNGYRAGFVTVCRKPEAA